MYGRILCGNTVYGYGGFIEILDVEG